MADFNESDILNLIAERLGLDGAWKGGQEERAADGRKYRDYTLGRHPSFLTDKQRNILNMSSSEFSPQAWGCTAGLAHSLLRRNVFPIGIGAFVPFRAIAMTSSVAWVAFYLVLINMVQQLNLQFLSAALDGAREASELALQTANMRLALALGMTIAIELVLPLALPYALIRLVSGLLTRQLRAG